VTKPYQIEGYSIKMCEKYYTLSPMPHVVEKLIMLKNGVLTKPIDIFDLFYHLIPTIILILKIYRDYSK
jgi:hypothetical protein